MKIQHRVGLDLPTFEIELLRDQGVDLPEDLDILIIDEAHPAWKFVASKIAKYDLFDFVQTKFSEADRKKASLLTMGTSWHWSYPQPEDSYRESTYDPSAPGCCKTCWLDHEQNAPFRMKSEPKWGTRHVLQLNWVFDEFFVRPEVYHDVFEKHRITSMPVIHHKTGKELKTVVQLVVDTISDISLEIDNHATEHCDECGRDKLQPWARGYFPSFDGDPPEEAMFKTQEFFGSGGSANRAIVITSDLYQELKKLKIKGIECSPVLQR